MTELLLNEATLDALADRVAAKVLAAQPKAVMSTDDAREYTGHNSLAAFYRWAQRNRVRPMERGRYSRRRLDVALGTGGQR